MATLQRTPTRRRFAGAAMTVVLFLASCANTGESGEQLTSAPLTQPTATAGTPTPTTTRSPAEPDPAPTPPPSPPTPVAATAAPEATTAAVPATPSPTPEPTPTPEVTTATRTGARVLVESGFASLQGMRVGLITHQPSQVDGSRLADLLHQEPGIELVSLFAPEHGLDGTAAAGALVGDTVDPATSTPVFSLYGRDRSPGDGTLADVDVLVYDLQDVGSRFFTYTSTLGLSMQAAAQAGIPFVVLDRPNPLGGEVRGPVLEAGRESFIGLYPIPSAYGLTSGELALLIQRQGWLDGLDDLDLRVVPVENWTRDQVWAETGLDWIAPSPNLVSADAALVYPGTVLFEATSISEGRGTDEPFLTIAGPWIDGEALAADMNARQLAGVTFESAMVTPRSIAQAAPNPRYLDQQIFGVHIEVTDPAAVAGFDVGLHLLDAILRQGEAAGIATDQIITQPELFDRLAGTSTIRTDLTAAESVTAILESTVSDNRSFTDLITDALLYE